MKTFKQFLAISGVTLTLALAGGTALAQGGGGGGYGGGGGGGGYGGGGGGMGNFDPTQMLQMVVERLRPALMVTNDAEWGAISPRILKVVQLRMQESMAGMSALAGGFGGGGGGGGGGAGGMRRFGALGGPPDPAEEALQNALADNAPSAAIKTALANVRESRRKKQAARIQAQSDLRELLTPRQEAYMVMIGMLE